MASRRKSSSPAQQPTKLDSVESFRATVPPVEGCTVCAVQLRSGACLEHALRSALTISDVMTGAFRDAVPQAVEGERVPGLEQALRAVLDLVQGNADALGEMESIPGATLLGLALQVQALVRGVLR